jgi:peptide deformylase
MVGRSASVKIAGFDPSGNPLTIEAEGLQAVCFQHEIDHLDGVLFIDHLSQLKRDLFRRWWTKHKPA